MEYRKIGGTGLQASVIGLGGEYLDGQPYDVVEKIVHTALQGGVNLMDIFMPGETVRKNIGKALGSRRKEMMIQGHIGSVDLNQQYDISRNLDTCKRYFEDLLTFLNTDYIDFGMLFFLDTDQAVDDMEQNGVIDYVHDLKRQGVVRHIGASSHSPAVARRVVESGLIDLLLFSINPVFDMLPSESNPLDTDITAFRPVSMDPARAGLYTACAQNGVSISVMKTLAAGKLLRAEQSPFAKPMSVGQCIHYALSRPAVVSTLIGAGAPEQMEEALGYLDLSEKEKDFAPIISNYKGDFSGKCVYCNHCLPCPASINIAEVHRCLDVARLSPTSIPQNVLTDYKALAAHGGDCIACGSCEKKCPFGVSVISDMADARMLLGR